METVKVKLTGLRPVILHNGFLADWTNPYIQDIKKITSKGGKKMTDADHRERDRLEWEGGLYWSEELGEIAIPSDNLEKLIQEGAKKNKLGKDFTAAVLVSETEVPVVHKLSGKTKDRIYADPGYTIRKGVKINKARIIRVRPMVPTGWTMTFTVEYDETIITNKGTVLTALVEAGARVGLGDWRPKFGRFSVEEVN